MREANRRTEHPGARRDVSGCFFGTVVIVALGAADISAQASFELRDSSGVRVVTSDLRTFTPEILLLGEPLVSVGALEGPPSTTLHRVTGVSVTSAGLIRLINNGVEIRYYDSNGDHVRTVGREGDGPGEFRSIARVRELANGQSLVADERHRRLSVLSTQGGVIATHSSDSIRIRGSVTDGTLFGTTGGTWSMERQGCEGVAETSLTIHLMALDGEVRTVGTFPGVIWFAQRLGGNAMTTMILPWSPTTATAGGYGRLAVGWTGAPRVHLYDETGMPLRIIEWNAEPVPLRAAEIESRIAERRASGVDRAENLREMPLPKTKPYFDRLLVDFEGRVWVGLERSEDGSRTWWVFNRAGVAEIQVRTPASFRVDTIREGVVAGIWRDELGVEYAQLLPIESARRASG